MNFLQCYETLGLHPGCPWEELQSGYRRQVQKWHPDRYEQTPEQQSLAAQRMLSINEAFGILAQHYRQFGTLPGEPADESAEPEHAAVAETEMDSPDEIVVTTPAAATIRPSAWDFDLPARPEPPFPPRRRHDPLSALPWIVLFALFGLGYFLLAHLAENGGSEFVDALNQAPARTAPGSAPQPANTLFFTRGDTPGRVIEIQGIPTRTSGELWFYGESEVYFEKGVVASWQSSPSHPLRVQGNVKLQAPKPGERPVHP